MSYRCLCGNVISDHTYPSEVTGDLKWQTESESASQDALQDIKEFLTAVENGSKEEWLRKFFRIGEAKFSVIKIDRKSGERITSQMGNDFYLRADMATVIYDIFSRYDNREGHSVYRCPECERIYIQKQYGSDEYDCYEKRQDYNRISDIDNL